MTKQNSFNRTLVDGTIIQVGSDGTGDIYYRDSSGFLARLGIGSSGEILTISGGLPSWAAGGGGSPTGAAGGDLTGTYPNPTIASNAVTLAKVQNIATTSLLGRSTAGTGVVEVLGASSARSVLGLGTAALTDTGTGNGNVPVLDGSGKLATSVLPGITINATTVVADQTARLALSANVGDIAKQTDNGIAYILQATPASTNGNWITIGDTAIDAADIATGTVSTARLGSGTANSTTFLRGDQTYAALPFVGLPVTNVSGTTQTMVANNAYRPGNAGLCTLTLPTTAADGTIIRITGMGAGGWRIAQNASQLIYFGNLTTATGITGRIDSTHRRDCLTLECVVANNEWAVIASQGNPDVTV